MCRCETDSTISPQVSKNIDSKVKIACRDSFSSQSLRSISNTNERACLTIFPNIPRSSSQKVSDTRRILDSPLNIWASGQTRSFTFDVLHK